MAMNSNPRSDETSQTWSPRCRAIVSCLLLFHCSALVVSPCAVDPTSNLFRHLWSWYQPYLDVAYLNHGYHFFAPEPGPSHLVRYELTFADDSTKTGFFPDRDVHKPRLLYHRHFMLTEFINSIADAGAPPAVTKAYIKSYAEHLLSDTQAVQVKLHLIRHLLPSGEEVLAGVQLKDPRLYRERWLATVLADGAVVWPEDAHLQATTISKPEMTAVISGSTTADGAPTSTATDHGSAPANNGGTEYGPPEASSAIPGRLVSQPAANDTRR